MARNLEIVGLKRLTAKLNRMGKDIGSARLMGQIGSYINLQIKARTARGVDVEGRPFKPYSAAYRQKRQVEGHPVSGVNLFFTGSMFSALTYEAERYKVTSFFMDTVDKVGARNPEKAFFNDQLRPFFGLAPEDIETIEAMVREHLNKLMEKG